MVFENVQGAVDIRNQAVYLKKLTMRGLEADLETTLVYRARRKTRGYAGFDFRLRKVNIGKLVDFIPSLDTIVPMLRSFKGMVDFDATAEAVLDSNLNVKIPKSESGHAHLKANSLVLMDGDKKLVEGTDYTVKYENNTQAGTATIVITGKGNYTGR